MGGQYYSRPVWPGFMRHRIGRYLVNMVKNLRIPKCRCTKSRKICVVIFIVTVVRTSNPTKQSILLIILDFNDIKNYTPLT
jgi:hypothetical protein